MAMLYAFALLAAAAQPSESRANLPDLFAAVCLDGQARLSPGDVAKIKFDELPSGLKQRLGNPASGDVWQVGSGGRTYLYVLNYPDAPGVSPKICGLASDEMSLNSGAEMLDLRLAGGGRLDQAMRSRQWVSPRDGYIASATTASRFNVLQVNWLSTQDRKRLSGEVGQLPH
jgi:hypothetical protein